MILDGKLLFDSASAITSTSASANVIDLGVNEDIGIGDTPSLQLLVQIIAGLVTANAATLNVQYQASVDNATWVTIAETGVLAVAALGAGAKIMKMSVPNNGLTRYLRLNYVVGTGVFTGGTITAGIILGREDMPYYPANYNANN